MPVTGSTDPKLDKWLAKQPPRIELALRYAIPGKFMAHSGALAHTARIDQLFAAVNPSEDELAVIMRHSGEIRIAMERGLEVDGVVADLERALEGLNVAKQKPEKAKR